MRQLSHVKLVSERILSVRSEERLQNTLLTVEEMRRIADKFKRGKITKADLTRVIGKYLKR